MPRAFTYTAVVAFTRADGTKGSVVLGADTATAAAALGDQDATYYQSMGWSTEVTLWELCARCVGSGRVPARRKLAMPVTCPMCRGRKSEQVLKVW